MSFFNGGGGDLKSSNLPAALFEVAMMLKLAEIRAIKDIPNLALSSIITIRLDFNLSRAYIDAAVPIYQQINSLGIATNQATGFSGFPYDLFDPGSNGSISTTNKAEALIEIAQLLWKEEASNSVLRMIKLSSTDTAVILSAKLPFAPVTQTGATEIKIIDYLE